MNVSTWCGHRGPSTVLFLTFLMTLSCLASGATTAEAKSTPTVGSPGPSDAAELARENAKLRTDLRKAEERITKRLDEIDELKKTMAAGTPNSLKEDATEDSSRTWWEWLFSASDDESIAAPPQEEGCASVWCCFKLIAQWSWEMVKFFFWGVWWFLSDPFDRWEEVATIITGFWEGQMEVASRILGGFLAVVYLNILAWLLLRVGDAWENIKAAWTFFWDLPIFQLILELCTWASVKLSKKGTTAEEKKMKALRKKLEALLEAIKNQPTPPKRAEQRPPTSSDKPCPNCGGRGHTLWTCQAPKKCLVCKSKSHLARDCPKRKASTNGVEETRSPPVSTNVVEETPPPPPPENVQEFVATAQTLCTEAQQVLAAAGASQSRQPLMRVMATVGEHKEELLTDSGSSVNVMPLSTARKHGLVVNTAADEAKMRLKAFNATSSSVLGTVLVPVKIGGWKASIPFVVTEAEAPLLLGLPGLTEFNILVDAANNRLADRQGGVVCCLRAELTEAPEFELVEAESKN